MSPGDEYWAAVAQVVPLVAFALVVEMRGVTSHWADRTPGWYRGLYSSLWSISLVILTVGEAVALAALRGVEVWSWWPLACELSVAFGLGTLVLVPLIEILVRTSAAPLARLFSLRPVLRFRQWRTHRKDLRRINYIIGRFEHLRFRLYLRLARVRVMIARVELALGAPAYASSRAHSSATREELLAAQNELLELRSDDAADILVLRARRSEARELKAKHLDLRARQRRDWRHYSGVQAAEIEEALRGIALTAAAMEQSIPDAKGKLSRRSD